MLKNIAFVFLFISSTSIIANESEKNSIINPNLKNPDLKETSIPNGSDVAQDSSDTGGKDKEKVSGCSDPDLEMLGLDYMCK